MPGVTAASVMISGLLHPGGTCVQPFCGSAFFDEAHPADRTIPNAISPAAVQTATPAPTPVRRIVDFLSTRHSRQPLPTTADR